MISPVKLYMLSIMKDQRGGIFAAVLKSILRLLSWVYTGAIKIVDWAYTAGIRRVHEISIPVVSVGNITLGGTGKTPFTMFLANYYSGSGRKPGVLIRGYGKDERRMLRDELPDARVFAGQDRVRSARMAVKDGMDVLILDDGFQHRRISRDLNILMLDPDSMLGNSFLFPRGMLREPLSSVKRADVLVLSKIDKIGEERKKEIIQKLKAIAPDKVIVQSRHKPVFLNDVTGTVYSTESLKGQKVCLASGIADPEYFASLVKDLGAMIALRYDYADHYNYRQKDINMIYAAVKDKGIEKIITTKKDYVKMQHLNLLDIEEKVFILDIEVDVLEGKEALVDRLNSVVPGQGT
jgi:tetraacyldisaccharide 4'-kinase